MKSTPWVFGLLIAAFIAGCGGPKRNDTGVAGGATTDTSTMQTGAAGTMADTGMNARTDTTGMSARSDTGMMGQMNSDSARTGSRMHKDTSAAGRSSSTGAKSNQTKSGVTDTRTGKSTLGKGVTRTRPDQGQPVTSKGDTLRSGGDSVPSSNQ
jgi:hypothetical protein